MGEKKNCMFDSSLFFFPTKPHKYNGSSLRLQLMYQMATQPQSYKVTWLHIFL